MRIQRDALSRETLGRSTVESTITRLPAPMFWLCAGAIFLLASAHVCGAAEYYVNGILGSDLQIGSFTKPFKTIRKATQVVRPGDVVYLRGGTYRETIAMTKSGTDGAPIVFKPYNGERVVVTGSDPVRRWKPYTNQIWQSSIPISIPPENYQLFADRTMLPQAREPKLSNFDDPFSQQWVPMEKTDSSLIVARELDRPENAWSGSYVWGQFEYNWSANMATVTASSPGTLILGDRDEWWTYPYLWPKGQGAVIGGLAALDHDNEWHYVNGTLYFQPPDGEDPSRFLVEVKNRLWVVDITGSYITVEDINFFAGQIRLTGDHNVLDNITALYGTHFVYRPTIGEKDGVENGNNGIYIMGQDNSITNSEIAYSAGSAIVMVGDRNSVRNCLIHEFGYMGTISGVVFSGQNSSLIDSTLYDSGRALLVLGGGFGSCMGCKITMNLFYNDTLLAADSGAIYSFGRDLGGTEISYNWVISRVNDQRPIPDLLTGVYLDNGSRNANVHHNVVVRNVGDNADLETGIATNTPHYGVAIYNNTVIHETDDFTRIGDQTYCNCGFDANDALQPTRVFEKLGYCKHTLDNGEIVSMCVPPCDGEDNAHSPACAAFWKSRLYLAENLELSAADAESNLVNPTIHLDENNRLIADFRPKPGSGLSNQGAYNAGDTLWVPGYSGH